MSRRNSRCAISQRNSRCSSVEPLDILEEEPEFKPFINRQEVLAEEEMEDDYTGDHRVLSPPHNFINNTSSRRMSTTSSAVNSACPSRSWSRRSSPTRGELLRPDDEMVTVNRGGITMTIPRHLAHHVPPVLIGHLDEEGREICDRMCKEGCSPEEIVEFFKTFVSSRMKIDLYMKRFYENMKTSVKDKMMMLKNLLEGSNMSQKDFLSLVKSQFGADAEEKLKALMESGMTMKEAMEAFMKEAENKEKEELRAKLQALLDSNNNLSPEELLEALKNNLCDEDRARMEEMLKQGMTMEEILKHFTGEDSNSMLPDHLKMDENNNNLDSILNNLANQNGEEMSDFAKKMQEMMANGDLSPEQMLEIMRNQLGDASRAEMEEMLRQGYSMQEIIEHMMKHGKTQDEENTELQRKLSELIDSGGLSAQEALNLLQNNLSDEAKRTMEELLRQGYSMDEVIRLFKNHGNDLSAIERELANATVDFEGEPPDAHLYANRNVFTVITEEEIKKLVPFMSPSLKNHPTFKEFVERVKEVTAGRGLTHREILDVMEFRMGGTYLSELKEWRASGLSLPEIVKLLIEKDTMLRRQAARIARLKGQLKVDANIELKRKWVKQNWGVQVSYTYSDENGLHLVMVNVDESGPAWYSGVRPGDAVVTVNDWMITVMDRPHVALHLIQAGANEVKLGIQKAYKAEEEAQMIATI